jgi:ribulose 1,5-bisphosphate carboxylase large subunit-like protein
MKRILIFLAGAGIARHPDGIRGGVRAMAEAAAILGG